MEENFAEKDNDSGWFHSISKRFRKIVSYFKRTNPIGNIALSPEELSIESLPFTDYSCFEEFNGLSFIIIFL